MKERQVILVVDDQPQNVALLEAFLAPEGYEIVKAANGEEALGKLSGNDIDLILLDIMMPGIDGFEVTRRVRRDETYRLLPIVLVTGLRETEDRLKGIEAGCNDFISKPINMVELMARVRSLLKVKAYNDLLSKYQNELESEVTIRSAELNHAMENLQLEIIERKRAAEELKKSEERYRSIFENTHEGIFRSTPAGKLILANKTMAAMLGYTSCEEMITGITDIACQHYVNPEDRKKIEKMIGEHGFIKGHESLYKRKDGSFVWISMTMHAARDEKGQIKYYDGLAEDITNRKEAVNRMRKALGATIQAIAVIVETRDPYTAGHQRRAADLANAIATDMKLSPDRIEGIRISTAIHDLGKISVPAEILSKPTKLTHLEFGLIKTHPQSGYDILKDLDFPWPVARIVLEHHERMNGSGYPSGLSGESILMESRILAVADVVESMASHRPYRPARGLDAALEEIEANRGTLYDNTVVNSCLGLFREKGFQLKGV